MSRFYVGQRVRIKFSTTFPELNSTVGTVCDPPSLAEVQQRWIAYAAVKDPGQDEVCVSPDSWGSTMHPIDDIYFCPKTYQLEPLIPPRESCDTEFKASLDELLARQEQPV